MDSSLKDDIDDGGSLLNQANVGPYNLIVKALHLTGSWCPCSSIYILVSIEVVHKIFCFVERFDLSHSELRWAREV